LGALQSGIFTRLQQNRPVSNRINNFRSFNFTYSFRKKQQKSRKKSPQRVQTSARPPTLNSVERHSSCHNYLRRIAKFVENILNHSRTIASGTTFYLSCPLLYIFLHSENKRSVYLFRKNKNRQKESVWTIKTTCSESQKSQNGTYKLQLPL